MSVMPGMYISEQRLRKIVEQEEKYGENSGNLRQ